MDRIKDVCLEHAKRYVKMQPQDAVKLVFQSEFGGGHLISDEQASINYLIEEARGVDPEIDQLLFEEIGNNVARANLAPFIARGYSLSTLNRLFVTSSKHISGDIASFEDKLDLLRSIVDEGEFNFTAQSFYEYMESYRRDNYPIPRHSDIYRKAYKPAYRLINSKYAKYIDVFDIIEQRLMEQRSVIMAIDGRCGSGKTSLSTLISEVFDCNVIHMDEFFLPPDLRTEDRLKEAGGNVHYERFQDEVIAGLLSNEQFEYRIFDCTVMDYEKQAKTVYPKELTIIEGTYSLHPHYASIYDIKVFTSCPYEVQLKRIRNRDGAEMLERFIEEWIPMEEQYFSTFSIPENCDLVLSDS